MVKYSKTEKGVYVKLRSKSKARRLEMSLTFDEFSALFNANCSYCNGILDQDIGYGYRIDRVDNALGYVLENCISCCGTCNAIKGERFTYQETKAAVKAIIELRQKVIT